MKKIRRGEDVEDEPQIIRPEEFVLHSLRKTIAYGDHCQSGGQIPLEIVIIDDFRQLPQIKKECDQGREVKNWQEFVEPEPNAWSHYVEQRREEREEN